MRRIFTVVLIATTGVLAGAVRSDAQINLLPPAAVTPGQKLFQAGIAALERNDLAAAESAFTESIKLDSGAAAPYMGLAQVAIRRGQPQTAETHIRKAVSLAPNSASIQTSWGAYLYATRELPAAEAALRKAIGIDPGIMEAHLHLGDLYLVAFRKADEAIKEYQTAVSLAPEHPGAHYALGLALLNKGSASEAEAELLKASELAPGNPLPRQVLGRLYSAQKQYDKALAAFDAALKIFPAFPAAHYERGQIFAARGDDTRALAAYAEAQKHDPKRSVGYTNIGMVHQRNKRWAEAEQAYLAAVKIEPGNSIAYNNLAWMAAERRTNLPQALTWAQKAVSLAPKMPEFQMTLGWVLRAQGDLAKAEQTLRGAVSLQPRNAGALYLLGRVYLERGKTEEGVGELQRALALEPNFPQAGEARTLLAQSGRR
jgi:tetratricopeptide (TPR) repeat protein